MTGQTPRETDVLVVGSGVAGCAAALGAARAGADVTLVTKATRPEDTTSWWAQGGVAVTRDHPDGFRRDVLEASDRTADPDAVDVLVGNARSVVEDVLVETLEVPFDTRGSRAPGGHNEYDYAREAAHSVPRVLHVNATTGRHILPRFLSHLTGLDAVTVWEDTTALELIAREGRIYGAILEREGNIGPCYGGATVLATGGIGALYPRTTNPKETTGDGIAMAALAGANVADVEYVQFHPTAYAGDDPFLVSEAVRGEGAVLRNDEGKRFMPAYHDDADLAPRDVVARAVARERERTGEVRLDVSPVAFDEAFPGLAQVCEEREVDPASGIPVAPAEHFLCGGIDVDDRGRASPEGLFAVGECARTGVHGANRLASTSLLEGLVWGLRSGESAADRQPEPVDPPELLDRDPALPPTFADEKFHRLRRVMGEHVGIERTPDGLNRARATLRRLKGEVDAYVRTRTSRSLYQLRAATVTALLIARAAAENPESRGCHHLIEEGDEGEGVETRAGRT